MADVRALKREQGPLGAHGYLDEEVAAGRAVGVVVLTVDLTTGARTVRSCAFGDVTTADLTYAAALFIGEANGQLIRGRD